MDTGFKKKITVGQCLILFAFYSLEVFLSFAGFIWSFEIDLSYEIFQNVTKNISIPGLECHKMTLDFKLVVRIN